MAVSSPVLTAVPTAIVLGQVVSFQFGLGPLAGVVYTDVWFQPGDGAVLHMPGPSLGAKYIYGATGTYKAKVTVDGYEGAAQTPFHLISNEVTITVGSTPGGPPQDNTLLLVAGVAVVGVIGLVVLSKRRRGYY